MGNSDTESELGQTYFITRQMNSTLGIPMYPTDHCRYRAAPQPVGLFYSFARRRRSRGTNATLATR